MMHRIARRTVLEMGAALGCAGMAASTGAAPALASGTIRVTAIDGYPARAMWVREFSNFFIPEVDRRLAEMSPYTLRWQEAYGGTIVKPKGVLEGVELGLGDMGIVTTVFHNSALPSQAIAFVTPFICTDARIVARAVDDIAREFPAMQQEFDAVNQVYLATGVVLDSYQLFGSRPITNLADLEGKKVAGAGYNLRYLEGIPNAVGVRGGLTDFYNMLQTGVADAGMLWPEAANTFKIVEVAPHMLKADIGAVNSKTVTINKDFWDGLPNEVKTVLQEVAVAYRDHVAEVAMTVAEESREAFLAAGGRIVALPVEERARWAEAMPNIAAEWAAGLDAAGKPGTAMLRAYIGKLRDAGQVPARDWSADV